jgi:hypothetical protein
MNKINAEPYALNHVMQTSLRRPSPSWARTSVLVGSLATVGFGPVPIQVALAAESPIQCNENQLIMAIGDVARNVLSLAQGCVYVLTSAASTDTDLGDNGLPVISRPLTIKGNGATITRKTSTPANPVPKFRIFQVAPGGDLTISDLTVDNGDTSGVGPKAGRGGGISNLGNLKVTNSTFSHNHASFGGGGIGNGIPEETGVPAVPGDLTLSDSVFFDNDGGAIGGAIGNGAKGTMHLTECTISHNTASIEGGGVANQGTAILNKCTTTGNTVSGASPMLLGGGGIVNGGQLFLTDSPISGNSVTYSGPDPQNHGFGGGLWNTPGASATLSRSNVIDNRATGAGGILNLADDNVPTGTAKFGTVTLTSSDVTGNSTSQNGAGIANQGHMTITHSNVTGNNAMGIAGGIANFTQPNATTVATLTLTHSNVTGNSAAGDGGGIANVRVGGATTAATLTLTHSDVTNNNAGQGQHGGGIFNQPDNTVTLNQSTVAGNTPDDF